MTEKVYHLEIDKLFWNDGQNSLDPLVFMDWLQNRIIMSNQTGKLPIIPKALTQVIFPYIDT